MHISAAVIGQQLAEAFNNVVKSNMDGLRKLGVVAEAERFYIGLLGLRAFSFRRATFPDEIVQYYQDKALPNILHEFLSFAVVRSQYVRATSHQETANFIPIRLSILTSIIASSLIIVDKYRSTTGF